MKEPIPYHQKEKVNRDLLMPKLDNRIAFEGLDLLKMYQGSDKIDSRIYDRVFEGEVDCKDLEDVYRKFNQREVSENNH